MAAGISISRIEPNDQKGSRLCENAQEPTRRSIIFSIDLSPNAATALFLFRLTKSRRTFYAQIECLCFHTASVEPCRSISVPRMAGSGAEETWSWRQCVTVFTEGRDPELVMGEVLCNWVGWRLPGRCSDR